MNLRTHTQICSSVNRRRTNSGSDIVANSVHPMSVSFKDLFGPFAGWRSHNGGD